MRVLLCGADMEKLIVEAKYLEVCGHQVRTCQNRSARILLETGREQPDALVIRFQVAGSDLARFFCLIADRYGASMRRIALVHPLQSFDRSLLERQYTQVCATDEQLAALLNDTTDEKMRTLQHEALSAQLNQLGIQRRLRGRKYILLAVEACLSRPDCEIREIYNTIAQRFGTNESNVERCIRFAIESAWNHGSYEKQIDMFGYTCKNRTGRPTNCEMIYMIADRLRNLGVA